MRKNSDLDSIKNVVKSFLYTDLIPIPELPFFVTHPIFETTTFYSNKDEKWLDLNNFDDLEKARQLYIEQINNSKKLLEIYMLIRKPYKLTFIKYTKDFMNMKDLCYYLADAWVVSENPNDDINCPISYLVNLFKKCDKKILMTAEDYEIYSNLPPSFIVYRGVGVKRNPNGLSWTQNIATAKWFAQRWDTRDKKGYIQKAIVSKDEVLAYFNTRNEDEIVCKVPKNRIEKIEGDKYEKI